MTPHLVLVEPAGARNVGSVARLCANFGIGQLRLVAPRCDPLSPEARQMAVHGVAHLEQAEIYPDLAAALADCCRVVAATGRLEGPPLPLHPPAAALAWLLVPAEPAPREPAPEEPVLEEPAPGALTQAGQDASGRSPGSPVPAGAAALVFGREDRGLSNDELLQAGCLLHIPAAAAYPSLNLSHAVAVALHHLWTLRQDQDQNQDQNQNQNQGRLQGPESAYADPQLLAPRGAIEAALADAEALLLEVGYLHPHTARARMAKLRALLQRATLSDNDLALLRGMVCQLRWASRRGVAVGQDP